MNFYYQISEITANAHNTSLSIYIIFLKSNFRTYLKSGSLLRECVRIFVETMSFKRNISIYFLLFQILKIVTALKMIAQNTCKTSDENAFD